MGGTTQAAVDRYLAAMAGGDLDAVLDCFTDDVVLVTPERTFRGRDAFAVEWGRMLRGVFAPGSYTRTNESLVVEGDFAVLVWRADCLGTEITHGVSHFRVRDGRIDLMTGVVKVRPV